ncbi:MAG: hypothetical protein JETT_1738 [Candidatus Jettenia ecosi]|uniref:Secretin/TonB short N-terminal domain-containing protein n=1 Tax=Candidatus Jettenia ecosi TaxID=2494326 RepID=A0A533QC68_9BACT|nr:MAG: hypothetical protein JETT_1738 [Candidatus Jettenia ecosi]
MERCSGVIILLLPLLIITAGLFGGETDRKTEGESVRKSKFILTTNDSLLSLRARDASVKEILEAIGRRMKIEMVANIPDERITLAFNKLPLEDAIKSLSKNYAFIKESGKEKGRVMKITILPEGKLREVVARQELPSPASEETIKEKPTRSEPFKFEFDPSEFEKEQ